MLPDGRVLIVGGESRAASGSTDLIASTEIYDPATNSWSATGPLTSGRQGHTATVLKDGKVLVVGGQANLTRGDDLTFVAGGLAALVPSASAELFDPQTNSWKPVAPLASERAEHTTTLLPDGTVLVVGGVSSAGDAPIATSERYDPATDRWTVASAPTARAGHTATLLPDGTVLVVGGKGSGGTYVATAERYAPLGIPSPAPTATAVPTGTPTAVPGTATSTATRTATPAPGATATATRTPVPNQPSATPTNTPIPPTATPTPTNTLVPPTATPTPTNTPLPPTATSTSTPTRTPVPPTATPTNTPRPPTSTPTNTPRLPTSTPVPQPGTITGSVNYCSTSCFPASGASVSGGGKSTTVNANGGYTLSGVGPGRVTVTVTYQIPGGATSSKSQTASVPAGGSADLDFTPCQLPSCGSTIA
jgi:hypothetical protein